MAFPCDIALQFSDIACHPMAFLAVCLASHVCTRGGIV